MKLAPLFVIALVASGCVANSEEAGSVIATDTACDVSVNTLSAGTHSFDLRNEGSKVTEVYILAPGDRAVSEVENIGPGTSRTLTVELSAGDYEVACKPEMKGDGIRSALQVTGTTNTTALDPQLATSIATYRSYVREQADLAISQTTPFVAAVKAGNVEQAKALYGPSRVPWERIEPIAESFGDLDPRVDARENDVEEGTEWTGWHRLEKDLWVDGLQSDSGEIADQLLADLGELKTNVESVDLTASQISNGAQGLLDEVATGKVTGEEERYSHLDLLDFDANIVGAKVAIDSLRPTLQARDASLLTDLDSRFVDVQSALDQYRSGDSFVLYDTLTQDQIRDLANKVDALSVPISKVTEVVTTQ